MSCRSGIVETHIFLIHYTFLFCVRNNILFFRKKDETTGLRFFTLIPSVMTLHFNSLLGFTYNSPRVLTERVFTVLVDNKDPQEHVNPLYESRQYNITQLLLGRRRLLFWVILPVKRYDTQTTPREIIILKCLKKTCENYQ